MRTMLLPLLICAWIAPAIARDQAGRSNAGPDQSELNAANLARALREQGSASVRSIVFDTGKATIAPESATALAVIGDVLKRDASLTLEIQGHTDNAGAKAANLSLSLARAAAVRDYLVKTFGVPADRLIATGLGDTKPVADNSTDEGRAQNRRIELVKTTPGLKARGSIPAGQSSTPAGEWTGRVTAGMMAIGGETTGIVLVTDRDQLELQPADPAMRRRLEELNGKTVTIRGTLETVRGVEVRTRRIIKVTHIIPGTTGTTGTTGTRNALTLANRSSREMMASFTLPYLSYPSYLSYLSYPSRIRPRTSL